MKLAIDIIRNILLTKLEKDSNFDSNKINSSFWETFTTALLDFESDAKPIFAIIYSLELENAEKIISKLPAIYSAFIKELAEEYVLGNETELSAQLLESKNETFLKEVRFLKTIKAVITKVERQELKKNLPTLYDRLVFELDEETLRQVAKKKSREDLRDKFKQWDEEMVEEKAPRHTPIKFYLANNKESNFDSNEIESILRDEEIVTNSTKSKGKVISLSWIKYAVAACVVMGLGFWFYTNQNQDVIIDNKVVIAPVKKDTISNGTITTEIPSEALAEVATVSKTYPVIESSLGFATTKIKIIENNQKARIVSIVIAIEKYQKMLEKEFIGNKAGDGPRADVIKLTIDKLQNELAILRARETQYVFDGKVLELYVSTGAKENTILLYEDTYYLKRDTTLYRLTVATQPQPYIKENNSEVVNALDKILYDNGK